MVWQRLLRSLHQRNRSIDTGRSENQRKRSLRLEALAKRELLASDLGAITGTVFRDVDNDSAYVDTTDQAAENATVELFLDANDDGSPDGAAIQTDTVVPADNGVYRFDGLGTGVYLVQQQSLPGRSDTPAPVRVELTTADQNGAQTQLVDNFLAPPPTPRQEAIATSINSNVSTFADTAGGQTLGGERDIRALLTSGAVISVSVASGGIDDDIEDPADPADPPVLQLGSMGAEGSIFLQYDGADASPTIDETGLGGVSLAGGNPGDALDPHAGLAMLIAGDLSGNVATATIYTDESNFAVFTSPVAAVTEELFFTFSNPDSTTGTPDFNNVGAIEIQFDLVVDSDPRVLTIETLQSDETIVDLANATLTVGGTLFSDSGTATNFNNGMLDALEPGLDGAIVELYDDPDNDGVIDASTQTAIATTTSAAGGDYAFPGLDPGDFLVLIPSSELETSGPLAGFVTSTGNDPAPDPDDDQDDDDNGTLIAATGIETLPVTLSLNGEPINDGDQDDNTNFTVDFGLVPTIDLAIIKTLDSANSTLEPGGAAVFDIAYINNGPEDATGVEITDSIPVGLTIDLANSDFRGFTPVIAGQDITVPIGDLDDGMGGTITIATTIDAGQTADLTNTAAILGDQLETVTTNNMDDAVVDLMSADLAITVVDDVATSIATDEQFTYTITVTNGGPDDATGVQVIDNLPTGISFVSGSFTSGSTTGTITESPQDSGQLTITLANPLVSGSSEAIEIIVLVASDAPDLITNTATVSGTPDIDPDDTNNSDGEITAIVRNVDVGITKTAPTDVVAGGTSTYTFVVVNNGPGIARDVEVVDTLDDLLTFDSFDPLTSGVTLTQDNQVLTFDVGILDSGESRTFTIDVNVDSSASGTIANNAVVSTSDNDTESANDIDDTEVAISRETDLIISKTGDPTTAVPGQSTLTYSFEISHHADSISDSGAITFTDTLPDGLTGATITAPTAISRSFDSDTGLITIEFNALPVGNTEVFSFTTLVDEDATSTITNTGSFTVAGGETDTTNNSDDAVTILTPEFDVTIDKTVDDLTPAPGSDATYTVALSNSGPSTATNVVLTDDIPSGLTFVSGTLNGLDATSDGTTITFPAITLDSGETNNATLIFTVGADEDGAIINTAEVTADPGETDTDNNSDTAIITATPVTDLTVEMTVDRDTAGAGDTLVYSITVMNSGASTAVASMAVDTLPAGVTFESGVGPDGSDLSAVDGVVTVDGGDLAAAASFSFTINATVDEGTSGTVTNNVTVSTTTNESDTSNNDASAATLIDPMTSTIGGSVYIDANDDGIRDPGEEGVEGVTIRLTATDNLGNVVDRTVLTDANGDYLFDQLAAGIYRVDETQPNHLRNGKDTAGTGATATVLDDTFADLDLGAETDAIDFIFGELSQLLSKRRFLASST